MATVNKIEEASQGFPFGYSERKNEAQYFYLMNIYYSNKCYRHYN